MINKTVLYISILCLCIGCIGTMAMTHTTLNIANVVGCIGFFLVGFSGCIGIIWELG